MKILLAAINGIMTGQVNVSWPDKLDAWMFDHAPDIKVLKKEYFAGPFPHINCWLKDPRLAHSLANELELFVGRVPPPGAVPFPAGTAGSPLPAAPTACPAGLDRYPLSTIHYARPDLWFVSHSNGAVITLLAVEEIIARGHRVSGIILIGAACEADIAKNGVGEWLNANSLGAAIAYVSPDDEVVPAPSTNPFRRLYNILAAPYGSLGRSGWLLNGTPVPHETGRLITRSFPGGHSTYFTSDHIESIFQQILSDITASEASSPSPDQPINCAASAADSTPPAGTRAPTFARKLMARAWPVVRPALLKFARSRFTNFGL